MRHFCLWFQNSIEVAEMDKKILRQIMTKLTVSVPVAGQALGELSENTSYAVRRQWHRSNADMYNALAGARTTAAKMYPGLTDPSTQQLVQSNWQAQRQKPSRRFKRKPFRKRGMRGDEENP
jgi:hypothetical protein